MGFSSEIEMIACAHELGLLTCPYVFDEQQAREMARAGADLLVAHAGLTTKGSIGAQSAMTLEEAAGFRAADHRRRKERAQRRARALPWRADRRAGRRRR